MNAPADASNPLALSLRQRLLVGGAIAAAIGILVLGAVYSVDTGGPAEVTTQSPVDGGGTRDGEAVPLVVDPVEGWFPVAGEGSGCSEPVGVDLLSGYGATLTINGIPIPEDETNVYVEGTNRRALSAGGSQGQVTWGPEPDCPFGEILRPTGNTVSACIYRLTDGPESCRTVTRPDTFDF